MNKYEKHKVICAELGLIYEKKNQTYGDAFGKTFKELGPISAVTRMTDKMNRIVSLVKGQENLVADESLIDTLRDLANYCIMTIIEMEGVNRESSEDFMKADFNNSKTPDGY
jgi:hypothetical protein